MNQAALDYLILLPSYIWFDLLQYGPPYAVALIIWQVSRTDFARRNRKWLVPAGLAVLTITGALIRWVMISRSGLWRDEALFLFIVRDNSWSGIIRWLVAHESHPPLFYLMAKAWFVLGGTSDTWALLLPVAIGAATIPVGYVAGTRMFGQLAGCLSACLMAFAPPLIDYGASMRPYATLSLCALLSVYFLWAGMSENRRRDWYQFSVWTLAMLFTHNWGWIVLTAEWLLVFAWMCTLGSETHRETIRPFCVAHLWLLLGYLPWLPVLVHQAVHAGHSLPYDGDFLEMLDLLDRNVVVLSSPLWMALLAALLISVSRRSGGVRSDLLGAVLVVGVPISALVLCLLASYKKNMLLPWCTTAVVPLTVVGIAAAVSMICPKRWAAAPWLLGAFIVGTYTERISADLREPKSNAKELAAEMTVKATPADLIIISPEWLASSFNYYFRAPNQQIDYPFFGREHATPFDNLNERAADPASFMRAMAEIQDARARHRRVWFISLFEPSYMRTKDYQRLMAYASRRGDAVSIQTLRLNKLLCDYFGPPVQCVASPNPGSKVEAMRAQLFRLDKQGIPRGDAVSALSRLSFPGQN